MIKEEQDILRGSRWRIYWKYRSGVLSTEVRCFLVLKTMGVVHGCVGLTFRLFFDFQVFVFWVFLGFLRCMRSFFGLVFWFLVFDVFVVMDMFSEFLEFLSFLSFLSFVGFFGNK